MFFYEYDTSTGTVSRIPLLMRISSSTDAAGITNAICSYTDFARRLLFCGLLFRPSVCHAFAVCHKMWPYCRDFDAANLSKKFKCKNEPCRTIFRG